jgi:hypothetical protein
MPVKLFRILRADIPTPRLGRFQTSPVQGIHGNLIYTANSVYQIVKIRIEIVTEDRWAG